MQYFLWYMWFLPLILPQLIMPTREAIGCLVLYVLSQVIHFTRLPSLRSNTASLFDISSFTDLPTGSLVVTCLSTRVSWRKSVFGSLACQSGILRGPLLHLGSTSQGLSVFSLISHQRHLIRPEIGSAAAGYIQLILRRYVTAYPRQQAATAS
jgi:hypothetical protein